MQVTTRLLLPISSLPFRAILYWLGVAASRSNLLFLWGSPVISTQKRFLIGLQPHLYADERSQQKTRRWKDDQATCQFFNHFLPYTICTFNPSQSQLSQFSKAGGNSLYCFCYNLQINMYFKMYISSNILQCSQGLFRSDRTSVSIPQRKQFTFFVDDTHHKKS